MFWIVPVRAARRFRIELEPREVNLLEPDARSIKSHNRVLANQVEESAALFLARPKLFFVSQALQDGRLVFSAQAAEGLRTLLLGMSAEPSEPVAESVLDTGIARHHEVDEFTHAGFARPGRSVARNNQFAQALDGRILVRGEKLRSVDGGPRSTRRGAHVSAGEGPAMESRKLAGGGSQRHHPQDFPPLNSLSSHGSDSSFKGHNSAAGVALGAGRSRLRCRRALIPAAQNTNLSPNWICRSGKTVPEDTPNEPLPRTWPGIPKACWLNRLKNSARNWSIFSSVIRVSLTSEKSTLEKECVRNVLRPSVPGRLCSEQGATDGAGHPGVTKTAWESD